MILETSPAVSALVQAHPEIPELNRIPIKVPSGAAVGPRVPRGGDARPTASLDVALAAWSVLGDDPPNAGPDGGPWQAGPYDS